MVQWQSLFALASAAIPRCVESAQKREELHSAKRKGKVEDYHRVYVCICPEVLKSRAPIIIIRGTD